MREWKRGRDREYSGKRERERERAGCFCGFFFSSFSEVKAESRMLFLRTRSTMIPD